MTSTILIELPHFCQPDYFDYCSVKLVLPLDKCIVYMLLKQTRVCQKLFQIHRERYAELRLQMIKLPQSKCKCAEHLLFGRVLIRFHMYSIHYHNRVSCSI